MMLADLARLIRRRQLRRDLATLGKMRRDVRFNIKRVEGTYRQGEPGRNGAMGALLAALAIMLTDIEDTIDQRLDQLAEVDGN